MSLHAKPKALKCEKVVKGIVTPLKKLSSFIHDKNKILPRYKNMMSMAPQDCSNRSKRKQTIAKIKKYLIMNGKKMGVALPLSGASQELGQSLLAGLRKGLEQGTDADLNNPTQPLDLAVSDTTSTPTQALRSFAELVLVEGVQTVVIHAPSSELAKIEKYSHFLRMPTIMFSSSSKIKAKSPFVMKVFPRASALAAALVKRLPTYNIKKIAMLIPEKQSESTFVKYFKRSLKLVNIEIDKVLLFNDTNYQQMDLAVKSILNIDPLERAEELSELIKEQKKLAEKRNEPFDASKVNLPPQVEFDALFIPQHISGIEHITRMLQYHGLEKTILIGDQQWRAPELLSSHNPLFKNVVFADFIGSYDKLPDGLRATIENQTENGNLSAGSTTFEGSDHTLYDQDDFFINPQIALLTDFRLIGFLAGYSLSSAYQSQPKTRSEYASNIYKSKMNPKIPFYNQGRIFNKYRQSNWPAFVFELSDQQLTALDANGKLIKTTKIASHKLVEPHEIEQISNSKSTL